MSLPRIPIDSYTYVFSTYIQNFPFFHSHNAKKSHSHHIVFRADLIWTRFLSAHAASSQQKKPTWRPLEPAAHFLHVSWLHPTGTVQEQTLREAQKEIYTSLVSKSYHQLERFDCVWWLLTMRWGGIFFWFGTLDRWGIGWQWRTWTLFVLIPK